MKDCLDTGWVSTAGQWVSRFEEELCTITGAAHAVAVTTALLLCGWLCTLLVLSLGMRCCCLR